MTEKNILEEEFEEVLTEENIDDSDFEDIVMEDISADEKEEESKKGFRFNIHIVLILCIVLILGLSAYKLVKWNKGTTIELDPTEDTSQFDVEVLDEIIPMSPADQEGHVYDDETTVLLLGNGAISRSRNDESSLAAKIADAANVTVYNGSFPAVTLATRNLAMIEKNYPDDIYSLSYIADAICSGDFSEIDRVTNCYHEGEKCTNQGTQTLKSVDYDNLDVIVIMYDAMDYFNDRAIENPLDDEERCTIVGSLNYAIRKIHQTYPYIRIIVSSPFYVEGVREDGSTYDPELENRGNGTLSTYFYNELNACTALSVSFLDNYFGTINQNNYKDYAYNSIEEGYIILTEAGQDVMAKRIAYAINLYPNDKKANK